MNLVAGEERRLAGHEVLKRLLEQPARPPGAKGRIQALFGLGGVGKTKR
ncbi:hypothetical protein [Microbispora sp. KK1-11]|nr:hypothetical protein [Microbispora sp. KK1-11]